MLYKASVFYQELWSLGHGHAMWGPEPSPAFGEVRLGDVGYLREGHFSFLFNCMLDAHDPVNKRGVPPDFTMFTPPDPNSIQFCPDKITQSELHSKSIRSLAVSVGASASEAMTSAAAAAAALRYQCTQTSGALLLLKDNAFKWFLDCDRHIKTYMAAHIEQWHNFATIRLGIDIKQEDIIFVSGCTKTSVWAEAAFHGTSSQGELVVSGGWPVPAVSGEFRVSLSRSADTSVFSRTGPSHRVKKGKGVETAPSENGSDVGSADQCIFLNYHKAKKRKWRPLKVMKAAAGPHDPGSSDEDDSCASSDDGFSTASEASYDSSSTSEYGSSYNSFSPVDSLLDHILRNSDADVACASDTDLRALFPGGVLPQELHIALESLNVPITTAGTYAMVGFQICVCADAERAAVVHQIASDGLPLGRCSEDTGAVPTPAHSLSGELMSSTTLTRDRQKTPNTFSALLSASFTSSNPRSSRVVPLNPQHNQAQTQTQSSQTQTQTSPTNSNSTSSAAAQAKAAEASSHRRMPSVTNPDESLGSPPPSYHSATFDPPLSLLPPLPLPQAQTHLRAGTADSSEPSRRSSFQSSSHLQAGSSQSSVPQKRSPLSPFFSPPNSSAPSSPAPGRSWIDAHASLISVENPPPPYAEKLRSATPPVPQLPMAGAPPVPILQPASPTPVATRELPPPPNTALRATYGTPESTLNKHNARTRPANVPAGPRNPGRYSRDGARLRAGSMTYLNDHAGPSASNQRIMSMMSHAAPRFRPTRVEFRGLTTEAAQRTLTPQELQHIVSNVIQQSADMPAICIRPLETLDQDLPAEIERMEAHLAELKTKYKLGVRKRNTLLVNASRIAECGDLANSGVVVSRTLEELGDVTESLDQTAEDLYTATDQLAQLNHLRDVHQQSALGMALRKLNSSFLKQVGEMQRLREQVATLEAERDEAWRETQEVAQELDDFTDRFMMEPASLSSGSKDNKDGNLARRSSRVIGARKNSQRASKAGLRSIYRRSRRSSTSSNHRYSDTGSPGMCSSPSGGEEIPPVPLIPTRRDLLDIGLGTRSSMESLSSDLHAMVQAQKDSCEMRLGSSLDQLKNNQGPPRRQSMSVIFGSQKSPAPPVPIRRGNRIARSSATSMFDSTLQRHAT